MFRCLGYNQAKFGWKVQVFLDVKTVTKLLFQMHLNFYISTGFRNLLNLWNKVKSINKFTQIDPDFNLIFSLDLQINRSELTEKETKQHWFCEFAGYKTCGSPVTMFEL